MRLSAIVPTHDTREMTLGCLAALERANVLIALQPRARDVLPPHLQAKVRTIVQSATEDIMLWNSAAWLSIKARVLLCVFEVVPSSR